MLYLSVIVPTYNSQSSIGQCLKSVRQSISRDYELIVVDCTSQDATVSIAANYADKVIQLQGKSDRTHARISGVKAASGQIIVNIDSDVVIKPDTLTKINNYFSQHPEIDALTGLLSKEHPNRNFFSQYKNLYMHYIFSKLPEKVSFLYGSIYAFRRQAAEIYDADIKIADDTALGQKFVSAGKQIAFLKDLEVIHLKRYNLFSFIKNDFQIPFDWAKIFLKYKGWRQLGKNKTGYAHSPLGQLFSVMIALCIFVLALGSIFGFFSVSVFWSLVLLWLLLNLSFFYFLIKEKSIIFSIIAIVITFLDNLVMAGGILAGFVLD